MQWHRSGLIASWEFLEEHFQRKTDAQEEICSERKWGVMMIIKSLQFLPTIITAALREAAHNHHGTTPNGSLQPESHGNMMHIALVGINNQMSSLQDRLVV